MRRRTKSQAEGKERTEQFQPRCTGKCAGLVGFRLPYGWAKMGMQRRTLKTKRTSSNQFVRRPTGTGMGMRWELAVTILTEN